MSQKIIRCHACGFINGISDGQIRTTEMVCSCCHSAFLVRKKNSIQTTWALVITGFILYIPANIFPVMTVEIFGVKQKDTIISGVIELFNEGMWPIGVIIFCASIVVPFFKLLGLSYLLITIHMKSTKLKRARTKLYRIIEFIGRWSMLDVFLLSILTAVVQFGNLSTVEPGIGAAAFAAVVLITMFAAMSFDPRLMWDN